MSVSQHFRVIVCAVCALVGAVGRAQSTETLPLGVLIERVACENDEGRSYALYLPSAYTPERLWPVLYVFDPRARGAHAAGRFQEGAERLGWIVAASNDSRNGPFEPSVAAANAMFRDTAQRLAIDRHRVYLAGFSGGGGLALGFAGAMPVAGLVLDGVVVPSDYRTSIGSAVLHGVAGIDDFNFHAMQKLVSDQQTGGGVARFATFRGRHEWMPTETAADVLLWLEIQAMRTGLRVPDDELVRASFGRWLAESDALPAGERWHKLHTLVAGFAGLIDTSEAARRASLLQGSREVKAWEKQSRAAAARQREDCEELGQLALRGEFSEVGALLARLRKDAEKPDDSERRRHARRVVQTSAVSGFEGGRQAMAEKDHRRAAAMYRLAALAEPENARAFFELARASTLAGSPREAVAALEQAAALGFDVAGRVEGDSDFDSLRSHAGFRALLEAAASRRSE